MTSKAESTLRALLIGAGTIILGAVCLGAWSLKESKADHDQDIAKAKAEQSETRALVQRVLDVMCERQQARACNQ